MSVLVGTLAVDVVNGQATFTLDDAKSKLDDFGKKVKETQDTVDYSMREARESIMMTGEAFGVHLPAGISRAIASISTLGPILEAAFPLAAIAAGVVLLIEHLNKIKEAAAKNAEEWAKLGDQSEESLKKTDKEILETQKALDELSGNKLGALKIALKQIDDQKFDNLLQNLNKVGDEIDKILGAQQRGNIMTMLFGQNAAGELKAGFDQFRAQYSSLLQSGDTKLAAELLEKQIGAVGKELEKLHLQGQNVTAPGLKEDEANARALYNQLIDLAVFQEKQQELAKDKKTLTVDKEAQTEIIHVKPIDWTKYEEAKKKAKELDERIGEEQIAANDAFTKAIGEEYKKREKFAADFTEFQAEQTALDKRQKASEGIDRLDNQYKLGLVNVRDYVQGKIALLNEEKAAELSYLTLRENMAKQDLDEATASNDMNARIAAIKNLAKATQELSTAQTKYNKEIADTISEGAKLSASWANYFGKMKAETTDVGVAIRTNLQNSITQFTNSFSQSMAKSIVEGKSLGKEMRQVATQILESMLSTLIKWVEQWIISHTIMAAVSTSTAAATTATQKAAAVSLAGANAIASWSAAPWPIDAGAPAFASSMVAAAAAFEQGGIVPGYGVGDSVPAMLSPGEMVLPKPISQGLQSAAANGGLGGAQTHYHAPNFQPKVSAVDAEGVDRVLTKHANQFHQKFKTEMRRRGK